MDEPGRFSVFDRFCDRLADLKDDSDRDLVLALTENFLWVRLEMYEGYLLATMKKLFGDQSWKVEKRKRIFICPLVARKDFGKLKSGIFMLYLCQSILLRTFPEFQEQQVRICETPEVIKHHFETHPEDIGAVILLDDFIGSGETAADCVNYLGFMQEKWNSVYVAALVAQQEGMDNIRKLGVKVFASVIRKKGISDAYPVQEASDKLMQMKKISEYIHADDKMVLGYLQSESLVAMIKTPNNTFPVFWYEEKKHPYAPFPRKENVRVLGADKERQAVDQ